MNISLLSSILSKYDISDIRTFLPVEGGIINQTYLIETGLGRFVLQGLNPKVSVDAIFTQNAISQYCLDAGVAIPTICRTKTNELFLSTDDKTNWKLTRWIDHGSRPSVKDGIHHAAAYLAKFHNALRGCDYRPPTLSIPHFHNPEKIALELKEYVSGEYKKDDPGFGNELADMLREVSCMTVAEQLIHADPKWNNFLFKQSGEVAAIIDLDTIMIGDVMIDIGDALRSWCKTAEYAFDRDLFDRAFSAYSNASELEIGRERALKWTVILALELSARYLIDSFEDSYFGWDSSKFRSRKDHNLFRASRYFKYASKIG